MDPGCVVIRGVATARFLCIEGDGRLYSSVRTTCRLSAFTFVINHLELRLKLHESLFIPKRMNFFLSSFSEECKLSLLFTLQSDDGDIFC